MIPVRIQGDEIFQNTDSLGRFSILPPDDEPMLVKTKTKTFNHINEYAISDGALWVRRKGGGNWESFNFNGGVKPVEIQADGANLIVIDAQRNVHYKKVLIESRKKGKYRCVDVTKMDNWEKSWFSFPVIEKIYHLFAEKTLKVPDDAVGFSISHRGKFNRYFEDIQGKKHPEFAMVTTFYVVKKNSPFVFYADPFLIGKTNHQIEGPDPDFKIEEISASASTILLSGTLHGLKKRYIRRADFDTLA